VTRTLDVRFVTCSRYPEGDPETHDLAAYLNRNDVATDVQVWNADVDWTESRLCVIRSAWDYHRHLDRFLAWTEIAATRTQLWNPAPLIRWNAHKRYLLDLEREGIPIVPTRVVRRGDRAGLTGTVTAFDTDEVIVKHAVSLDGEGMQRMHRSAIGMASNLVDEADVLVQPYVASVALEGEISALFIDGTFAHAVRKRAATGEFRVQERYGGTTNRIDIEPAFFALAERVVRAIPQATLYARVDMVRWRDQPCLGELELIEPSFYLRACRGTQATFFEAIRWLLAPP
jgi:glutathione synthase/RimK-type ligase-like ATP-grasp enzyme